MQNLVIFPHVSPHPHGSLVRCLSGRPACMPPSGAAAADGTLPMAEDLPCVSVCDGKRPPTLTDLIFTHPREQRVCGVISFYLCSSI